MLTYLVVYANLIFHPNNHELLAVQSGETDLQREPTRSSKVLPNQGTAGSCTKVLWSMEGTGIGDKGRDKMRNREMEIESKRG